MADETTRTTSSDSLSGSLSDPPANPSIEAQDDALAAHPAAPPVVTASIVEGHAVEDGNYDASAIQVLEGLEAVRKRPGMYIGSTGERGLHHLIWEIVDNAVDEALAGHCDRIIVTLMSDGAIRVEDNGRGIPTDTAPGQEIPALTMALTMLHAGGILDAPNEFVRKLLEGRKRLVENRARELPMSRGRVLTRGALAHPAGAGTMGPMRRRGPIHHRAQP